MARPVIPQGQLSRAVASVVWNDFPQLNVTPPYLGPAGISLSFGGPAASQLPTMTGVVVSPELMQLATIRINLLKTQTLADLYKQQMENSAVMGDCTIYPDIQTNGIGVYQINNCSMGTLETLTLNGTDAGWIIPIIGVYLINNALFGT